MRKDILKVVLIGDGGVGKTSLRIQFIHGRFTNNYKATIGADFITKEIQLDDGKKVSMQIWDTAGQERFQSLGVAYYRGADACIIVYDVTNPESFEHVLNWQHEFIDKADLKDPSTYPFILIGNKIDSIDERKIEKAKGKKMAKKMREQSIKETPHFELINQQTRYDQENKFKKFNYDSNPTNIKSYSDNLLAIHQRTSSFKRYNYLTQELENKKKANRLSRSSQDHGRRSSLARSSQGPDDDTNRRYNENSQGHYSNSHSNREDDENDEDDEEDDDDDDDDDEDSDNDFDFDNFKIPYFEASAKLGSNVEAAFNYIAKTVQLPKFEFLIEGDTINWDESTKTNSSCCF